MNYTIQQFRRRRIFVPIEPAIRSAHLNISGFYAITIELESSSGHCGQTYILMPTEQFVAPVEAMLDSLWPLLKGQACEHISQHWQRLFDAVNWVGHEGVSLFAISAFDTALWDLHGKQQQQSVHALLGPVRSEIKAYASGGLWLSLSIEQLQKEAQEFVAKGFRAMKMRIGSADMADDVARVEAVRETIGPEIELMVDANQSLNADKAIALGNRLKPYQLTWFEDPVMAYAVEQTAEIRRQINIPVITGENDYTRYGLQRIIDAGAADLIMPDINRVGGISEFYEFGQRAAAQQIQITPHMYTEQSLQLCGALENCFIAEHMHWFSLLFNEPMIMTDGYLQIPDRPGLGFTLNQDNLREFECT